MGPIAKKGSNLRRKGQKVHPSWTAAGLLDPGQISDGDGQLPAETRDEAFVGFKRKRHGGVPEHPSEARSVGQDTGTALRAGSTDGVFGRGHVGRWDGRLGSLGPPQAGRGAVPKASVLRCSRASRDRWPSLKQACRTRAALRSYRGEAVWRRGSLGPCRSPSPAEGPPGPASPPPPL